MLNQSVISVPRNVGLSVFCLKYLSTSRMASAGKVLTMDTLNTHIKLIEYAVRGPLVIRAAEIEKELSRDSKKPFTEVIRANIGDAHAMGQVPITYLRQVLALVSYPLLLEDPHFPNDAKNQARSILKGTRGCSMGSYTDSPGLEVVRRHAAQYIERRDGGIPSSWQNIILGNGASDVIKNILKLFVNIREGKKSGILIPIPQYPLYSACLSEFDLHQINYYLDEENAWGLDVSELQRTITEARHVSNPVVIVVINPGNPTGQVLTRNNIVDIIKFAHKEKLYIFADEVYQNNVYDEENEFHSFKKVLTEMGKPYSDMELASFMSCSKGYMGECGLRGGYAEIINMDSQVTAMYLKSISANLCPSSLGQAAMDVVVNPPKNGDPSYQQFIYEKDAVLESLKLRARMITEAFNSFEGFSCNVVQGAMYAFPQFKLPPKAIEEAKKQEKLPDVFYAFELLESTGICIIPGSGFGQKPGTFHFRTTILPQPDKLRCMLEKFRKFHEEFIEKYSEEC